jgi:hypothetical protein
MMLLSIGFALGMTSTLVGYKCEQRKLDLPSNPAVLRAVRGLASLLVLVLLVAGFMESWYLPLIAMGLGVALHWLWDDILSKSFDPAAYAVWTGLGCITVSAIYFFV